MTSKQLCCLQLKTDSCAAALGYEIVLKKNRGYDTSALDEKLKYIYSLRDLLVKPTKKTVKGGKILFCGEKVLLSKNNPLLLTEECKVAVSEKCCIDLCEIEAKLSSVCINC